MRISHTITADQLQEAYSRLGELKKVASEFQCSPQTIKRLMIKYNLPFWSSKIKHDLDFYIEIYNKYGSLTDAAEELGIHLETLRQVFIKNNIPYIQQVVYDVDHLFFNTLTPASMYWAGFIAADGNIDKNKNRIKLELSTKDKAHIEKFAKYIKTNAPIIDTVREDHRKGYISGTYYGSRIRFTSQQIVSDLQQFNIIPAKSLIYTFPEHLINHIYIHHFIRGLIDGDGWVYDNTNAKKEIGLSGTRAVVEYVFKFIKNKLSLSSGNVRIPKKDIPKFYFNKLSDMKKITNYLYQNCGDLYLERKHQNAQNVLQYQERKLTFDLGILKELYDKYNTLQEIADQLGCSLSTVKRRLVENNLYIGRSYK